MPIRSLRRPFGLMLPCAAAILLTLPALAGAKTIGAQLRVVGPSGQSLAQLAQYTSAVKVKTDPSAQCFGPGTGGSGAKVKVPGKTGLGIVKDALATVRDLRPLSVTDAFDFGLGVCGIGGFAAQGSASWYLKRNHMGAVVGGDQLKLAKGDEVLWYLAPSFPYPPELSLEAPVRAAPGSEAAVRVFEHADDGARTAAAGATVTGGEAQVTTDARGSARVPVGAGGTVTLRATRGADIPSNQAPVCVSGSLSRCDAKRGSVIAGTGKRDRIRGTKAPEKIKARARNDKVMARGGGPDRINCGAGNHDVAEIGSDDTARACEKVKRR